MRIRIWGLALLASIWVAGAGVSDDEIQWLDNYRTALGQAKRTGKPIFLEFRCEA